MIKNLILNNAKKYPAKVIIIDNNIKLTWSDLINRAFEYEKKLYDHSKNYICFYSDKTFESIAFIVACINLGKTFIPIERAAPKLRIHSQLSELNENLVFDPITDSFCQLLVTRFNVTNVVNNRAFYLLFTSGSTGIPKGVQVSEKNILNTLKWSDYYFHWRSNDVIGLATTLTFDISLFDILTSLTKSVTLCILPNSLEIREVVSSINKHLVTSIFSTPSLFAALILNSKKNELQDSNLRQIISGGDFFPVSELIQWMVDMPHLDIYNVWGPTETSIVNSAHKLELSDLHRLRSGKPISIGNPTSEMDIRLRTDQGLKKMSQIDTKTEGELVVLGNSVGLGYLNSQESSAINFKNFNCKRAFLTGDIGFFENREIYMIGRSSFLFKLQGFRIDPREVEFQILQLEYVSSTCVFLSNNSIGQPLLGALIVMKDNKNEEPSEFIIKKALKERLPQYMIPKKIVFVNKIPLNSNGKIDRNLSAKLFKDITLAASEKNNQKFD